MTVSNSPVFEIGSWYQAFHQSHRLVAQNAQRHASDIGVNIYCMNIYIYIYIYHIMQTYETQLKAIEGDDDDDDAGGGGDDECGLLLYALKVKRMLTCLHQSTRLPLILSLSLCVQHVKTQIFGSPWPLGSLKLIPLWQTSAARWPAGRIPPLTSRYQQYGPRNNTIQYCDPKSHLSLYDVIV